MKFLLLVFSFPVLCVSAQSGFDVRIKQRLKEMICPMPDESNPVTLTAQSLIVKDSVAVIVKVAMAPGWHIYSYVPSTQPYIAIDQILELPSDIKPVGEWINTEPEASVDDPGVLLYEREAVFIHKAVKISNSKGGSIMTGLYYQTCNRRQCLPPKENVIELKN